MPPVARRGHERPVKILTRYVLRAHVGPLIFALSALTAILLLDQIAKRFGMLVGKGLPWTVIGEFFVLSIPFIVAMTLPMAVLVAVLYAISHLAAENEVTAMRATGVSMMTLVRPVVIGGVVLSVLMLAFNDQVLPRSNHRLRTLETDIARKKPTFALREQVINEVSPGRLYLRAGHIDPATNTLREVNIYDFGDPARHKTIYADSGQMGLTPDRTDLQMLLHNGYMEEVSRQNPAELQRLYYRSDLVRVRGVENRLDRTTKDSYKSDREMSICEMDSAYQAGAAQITSARRTMGTLLAGAAYAAATGRAPPPPPVVPVPPRQTMGHLYCEALARVSGQLTHVASWHRGGTAMIPRADAAELPPNAGVQRVQLPAQKPGQQAVQRPAQKTAQKPVQGPPPPTRVAPPGVAGEGSRGTAPQTSSHAQTAGPSPLVLAPGGMQTTEQRAYQLAASTGAETIRVLSARLEDERISMSGFQVEIQKKFALAAACVVFVILGAPLALRFPRGGVGMVIGVSLIVFALYYMGLIAGQALAQNLVLSPWLSMWLANIVFVGVGIPLLIRMQHAGAAARGGGDASERWTTVRDWVRRHAGRMTAPGGWRRIT